MTTATAQIVVYKFHVYAVDERAAETEAERDFMGLPGAQRYEVTATRADRHDPLSDEPRWTVTLTAEETTR